MYSAKQRALPPLLTCLPATEQLRVTIGEAAICTPASCSVANSLFCACCAAVTSPAIAFGDMSGVPVICSCLRLEPNVVSGRLPRTGEARGGTAGTRGGEG